MDRVLDNMANSLTEQAHFLLEQVHSHLRELYLHSAERIEVIKKRQEQDDDDPFVAIDEDDRHNIAADRHLYQLNGNVEAIDRIMDELSDENSHLHMRLTALRSHLDGATSRLHDSMRDKNQKSMRHWEELRTHLDSCHLELNQTKKTVIKQMQEKQLKLTVEYIKNQEYGNAACEFQSLSGDFSENLKIILDEVYGGSMEEALKFILFLEQLNQRESTEGFSLLVDQLSKNDQLYHPIVLVILSLISNLDSNDKLNKLEERLSSSMQFLGDSIKSSHHDQFASEICKHLSLPILAQLMREAYQEDIRAISEFVMKLPIIQQRVQCCVTLHEEMESRNHFTQYGILILVHIIKNTMDLSGFSAVSNSDTLIKIKDRIPDPLIDIFWHTVRFRFGKFYMEAKHGHGNFSHGMSWDYLSSNAGKLELISYKNGEEFEIRNVMLQQFLLEKDHHLRWSPKDGDRWQLIPKRSETGRILFRIRNLRTENYICSCLAHGFSSMEPDTENELAIKFRCFGIDTEEEEGHFDVMISRFQLEREHSDCNVM